MPDELKPPCLFCSAILSKDGENFSTSFCGNVNCPFSGIDIHDDWWKSAYCWKLLDESRETIRVLREIVDEYACHTDRCILAQWQAGEPTVDGGYRSKYAGKWYQSKPIDETPKCDCGFEALLATAKEGKC